MGDKSQIKRLSIKRHVDLIFAFFKDASVFKINLPAEKARREAILRYQVQRQIENAVRDDREILGGHPLALSDEELCPACGIPSAEHGSIKAGPWDIRICAGVSGQSLFVIGPDAAGALIEQLKERDEHNQSRQPEGLANSGEVVS